MRRQLSGGTLVCRTSETSSIPGRRIPCERHVSRQTTWAGIIDLMVIGLATEHTKIQFPQKKTDENMKTVFVGRKRQVA